MASQERDKDAVVFGGFTGLRNNVDPERFDAGDLAVAENIDIDDTGKVSRRDGTTRVVTGARHSMWSDGNSLCLVVAGAQLKRINANYSETVLRPVTSVARMSYCKVADRVYFSNGIDTGIVENGQARTWGIAVPPMPGVAVTVGDMPAGTYQFTLTYFRSDGQESGAALAGEVVVPDGGGLVFTLPVSSDADVVSKGVYLTTPNGEILMLALLVPNATTSATYQNDTNELNVEIETQFLGPPPAGQLVGYYRGHMFVAAGDKLYMSDDYGYEWFDLRKYLDMDGLITLFAPMEDDSGCFIGTDKDCGVLLGKDANAFEYDRKTDYGAVLGAWTYVDASLFMEGETGAKRIPMWLCTNSACVGMPGMSIINLTRSKYAFTAAGQGAALFHEEENRFIAVFHN